MPEFRFTAAAVGDYVGSVTADTPAEAWRLINDGEGKWELGDLEFERNEIHPRFEDYETEKHYLAISGGNVIEINEAEPRFLGAPSEFVQRTFFAQHNEALQRHENVSGLLKELSEITDRDDAIELLRALVEQTNDQAARLANIIAHLATHTISKEEQNG